MYQELWFDSATATRSSTVYPANETPVFYFDESIQRVKSAKILEVVVPQSFYNFTSYPAAFNGTTPVSTIVDGVLIQAPRGHQQWRLQMYNPQNQNVADLILPAGGGSATEFADYMNTTVFGTDFAAFQTTFNTLTGLTLTAASIVYNAGPETLSWTFTVSTDVGTGSNSYFAIRFPEQIGVEFGKSFGQYSLGFPLTTNEFKNQNFNITYTSQYCNANPFNYVTLQSKGLGSFFSINPNAQAASNSYGYKVQNVTDAIAIIPLSDNYTSITRWVDPDPTSKFTDIKDNLDRVDFYLTLGPFLTTPLNLNGQSFQVKVGIETEDETAEMFKRARYF